METLLSLAFDNISSREFTQIRKGLRQIDGLLAQLCLSKGSTSSLHKQQPHLSDRTQTGPKKLNALAHDPAFREFFRLQEGFQWNVTSRLVACIERLMGMGNASQNDLLILSALDVLQGILLLHPPSRCLFGREITMNLLLDLLDGANPPRIQSQALLVLVSALLDCPRNTRVLEDVDGLLTVTSLFKSRDTAREVKMRTLEFLYFYLMPEAVTTNTAGSSSSARSTIQQGTPPTESSTDEISSAGDAGQNPTIRTTEEKQKLLSNYLPNVAELVQDLQETTPFGNLVR